MSSWRAGTSKQYNTYLNKWEQYCDRNKLSKFNPGLDEAIEFLTLLFESRLGYSALNTARSALSSILPLMEGEHPLVCRYLKGVFELRPTLPRYTEIWNVDTVLRYLTTLKSASEMTMKELSLRLTMLLCLLTAQRCQTVHQFDINFIQEFESKYRITVQQKLNLEPIELVEFVPDRKLCVVTHLRGVHQKNSRRTRTEHSVIIELCKTF